MPILCDLQDYGSGKKSARKKGCPCGVRKRQEMDAGPERAVNPICLLLRCGYINLRFIRGL